MSEIFDKNRMEQLLKIHTQTTMHKQFLVAKLAKKVVAMYQGKK